MPEKPRIFWTTQERNAVLTAARKLREQQPCSTLKQVGIRAQAALPKQRRRPVNNKLTSRLSVPAAQPNMLQTLIEQGAAIFERHPAPSERAGRVGKHIAAPPRFAQALISSESLRQTLLEAA